MMDDDLWGEKPPKHNFFGDNPFGKKDLFKSPYFDEPKYTEPPVKTNAPDKKPNLPRPHFINLNQTSDFSSQMGFVSDTPMLPYKPYAGGANFYNIVTPQNIQQLGLPCVFVDIKPWETQSEYGLNVTIKANDRGYNYVSQDNYSFQKTSDAGESYHRNMLDTFTDIGSHVSDAVGGLGKGMGRAGGSFRIGTNSEMFSPKIYKDVWHGNQYVDTYEMKGMGKSIGMGTTLIAFCISVYNIHEGYIEDGHTIGDKTVIESSKGLFSISGAEVGGEVGAIWGARIGVFFDGVGAAPGALIGGIIGAVFGGFAGDWLGELGGKEIVKTKDEINQKVADDAKDEGYGMADKMGETFNHLGQ